MAMVDKSLLEFSNDLKKQRESRNLTLTQISDSTKINIKFLEAIESGDFEVMPEVYIRAFIKSYSECINLDGTTVLKNFERAKLGKFGNTTKPETEKATESEPQKDSFVALDSEEKEADDASEQEAESSTSNRLPLIWGLLVIIVLILISYFSFFIESEKSVVEETPFTEVMKNQQETDTTVALIVPVEEKDTTLTLSIKTIEKCWISISTDNSEPQEYLLQPNNTKEILAKKEFKLIIGNPSGIKVFLNNNQIDFGGRTGKVVNCIIDKNGIKQTEPNLQN